MSQLLSVLDDVLAVDPRDLVDSQLADALLEFEQVTRRLDAARARMLAEFDARSVYAADGCASAAAWLRWKLAMTNSSAAQAVRLARGLGDLPLTASALADGRINAAHAGSIAGLAREIPLSAVLETEAEFVTERRSVAVTSNIKPSGFDTIMPKTLATTTVDRLLHHAHQVLTDGRSQRLAEASPAKEWCP